MRKSLFFVCLRRSLASWLVLIFVLANLFDAAPTSALSVVVTPSGGYDTTVSPRQLTVGNLSLVTYSDFEFGVDRTDYKIYKEYLSCQCSTAAWPRGVSDFDEARFIEFDFTPGLDENALVESAEIIFEYQKNGPLDGAKFEVWKENDDSWYDIEIGVPERTDYDQTFNVDISEFIDSAADANNLKIRFLAYTNDTGQNSRMIQTFHDYVALILNVNSPPILEAISDKEINEDEELSFEINASDPDGDAFVFSAFNLPEDAIFDSETGEFSWTPSFSASGSYPGIIFSAFDGTASALETVAIVVKNKNRPPILPPIEPLEVEEGGNVNFIVSASDLDGDTPEIWPENLPHGAGFNAASHSFEWAPDYSASGSYEITFWVSDGIASVSAPVLVKVLNVNRPPVLSPVDSLEITEEETAEFSIKGSDPDGDVLIFSANEIPAGSVFNPAPRSFIWTPQKGQAGDYNLSFDVSDGELSNEKSMAIKVLPLAEEPEQSEPENNGGSQNSGGGSAGGMYMNSIIDRQESGIIAQNLEAKKPETTVSENLKSSEAKVSVNQPEPVLGVSEAEQNTGAIHRAANITAVKLSEQTASALVASLSEKVSRNQNLFAALFSTTRKTASPVIKVWRGIFTRTFFKRPFKGLTGLLSQIY